MTLNSVKAPSLLQFQGCHILKDNKKRSRLPSFQHDSLIKDQILIAQTSQSHQNPQLSINYINYAVHPLTIHGIKLLSPSSNNSLPFNPYKTDISHNVNAGILGNNRIVPHCWPPSICSMPSGECDVLSWSSLVGVDLEVPRHWGLGRSWCDGRWCMM